jgi:hypothetical protein
VPDPTLLDTSEVELVDLKFLDEEPIVVVQFTCQQVELGPAAGRVPAGGGQRDREGLEGGCPCGGQFISRVRGCDGGLSG